MVATSGMDCHSEACETLIWH